MLHFSGTHFIIQMLKVNDNDNDNDNDLLLI